MVSRIFVSWNQIAGWLRRLEGLRKAVNPLTAGLASRKLEVKEVGSWQRLTGPSLQRSRASPTGSAARGCSAARVWPVATLIENLEELSVDEVIEQFDVTREQVAAVLEFVAQSLRASDVTAGAHPL
jgi:hypothetical protein